MYRIGIPSPLDHQLGNTFINSVLCHIYFVLLVWDVCLPEAKWDGGMPSHYANMLLCQGSIFTTVADNRTIFIQDDTNSTHPVSNTLCFRSFQFYPYCTCSIFTQPISIPEVDFHLKGLYFFKFQK